LEYSCFSKLGVEEMIASKSLAQSMKGGILLSMMVFSSATGLP
jgi:hypothetical protein